MTTNQKVGGSNPSGRIFFENSFIINIFFNLTQHSRNKPAVMKTIFILIFFCFVWIESVFAGLFKQNLNHHKKLNFFSFNSTNNYLNLFSVRFYKTKTYMVQPNDTYWRIGRKFNISYKEILKWNKKKTTKLYVGQIIKIPVPVSIKSGNLFFKPILPSIKKINFRRQIFNPYDGILYSAKKNNQVFSAKRGKVLSVDFMEGYDNYIIIQHKNNYKTVYGNLSKVFVKAGDWVQDKSLLGEVFRRKGLYFQINYKNKSVNPELYIR